MKRIAFVLPPIAERLYTFSYDEMYLGIGYLAAILEREGHTVTVTDCATEFTTPESYAARISELKPDVAAFSAIYGTLKDTYALATEARRLGVPLIVIGGLPASAVPERILKECPAIDIAVMGEGESTMSELMSDAPLHSVNGIAFRQDGAVVRTPPREYLMDLDLLPIPARHLFPLRNYSVRLRATGVEATSTIIETKRGCPFACRFCVQAYKEGRQIRTRSIPHILTELEDIRTRYPYIRRIMIVDNDFFIPLKTGVSLLNAVIQTGFHRHFEFMIASRLSHFEDNPALGSLCARANVRLIYFGVESLSATNRKLIGKVRPGSDLRALFASLRRYNIHSIGSYMIGFPNETTEDIELTIAQSLIDGADVKKYNIVTPYPGTPLYDEYLATNTLDSSKPLWHYNNTHKVIQHDCDLESLLKNAYYRAYSGKFAEFFANRRSSQMFG